MSHAEKSHVKILKPKRAACDVPSLVYPGSSVQGILSESFLLSSQGQTEGSKVFRTLRTDASRGIKRVIAPPTAQQTNNSPGCHPSSDGRATDS